MRDVIVELKALRLHGMAWQARGATYRNRARPRALMRRAGWSSICCRPRPQIGRCARSNTKMTSARFPCTVIWLGVTIKRLITDNGPAYRSQLFAKTCHPLGIKHSFTKSYRPQTIGKAERFIQTCLREWAYGRVWANSKERTTWLMPS